MRLIHTVLGLAITLTACDLPDIDDSGTTTTSGGDSGPITESSGTIGSATATATATASTTASTTAGAVCPPFDPGPVDNPHETYSYECFCDSCELSYEDIPLETLQLFENEGLCDCLCAEAGCGGVQGEGGVATGSPTDSGSDSDCGDTEGGTSGSWPDTDGGTTDSVPETDGGTTDSVPETDGGTGDMWPDTDGGTTDPTAGESEDSGS